MIIYKVMPQKSKREAGHKIRNDRQKHPREAAKDKKRTKTAKLFK